jgi:gliding motility-associated-like protein
MLVRFRFLLFFIFLISLNTLAQTPGLIFKPATGAGKAVLDPNGDGYTSSTTTGFTTDDKTQSEIPFVPLVFPMLEPTGDLGPGPDCSFTDFVDSGSEDPALTYFDGTNLLFRMRLGKAFPNSKGYSVLIDTDQKFGTSGPNADPNATATNPGFEIEINLQTNFGVFVYNVDGICPGGPSSSFAGETNYQKSVALTTNCGDPDYFYDFYVPFSSLTALGITASTPLRMAIVTQMNPQPGICNNALSDFGGIDDNACGGNPFACWNTIIDNYPPTSVANINTPAGDRSVCPVITGPIAQNATSVSGTSTEASGTTIKVYKNGSLIGSATTSGAAWTLSGISPALVSGDIITATATGPGESESIANCNPVTVALTCTSPIASVTACNANKAFSGTGTPGALIKLYYGSSTTPLTPSSGNLFSAGTITVDGTGAWLWRCVGVGQTTSCSAGGGPCLADGLYRITQTLSGQCESLPTYICIGGGAATATPTITTSPILTSTTTVAGTSVANASIILYAGTTQIGTTTASAGGVWSISGLSLTFGQVLTAKAISGTLCLSAASASVTVTRNTSAPIVTGTYCTTSTITSVSGTSTEAAGTVIQVFKNSVAHGATTTVASNGTWVASSGISFAPGDIISAKATITGGIQSAFSNTITVGGKTLTTATITTSPIVEGSSSVSGTGTNGNVIRLYIDGVQIGGTATVTGGVWTIGSLGTYDLYAGGTVTATATATGSCESNPSAGITVQCVTPLTSLTVDPPSTSVCSGSVVANAQVLSSQNLIIYQLYNGASPSGSSVLGTGGTITLTSAVLTASTTLTVKAIKIGGVTCESFLTDNIPVTVNANPTLSLTVTAATGSVCQGTGTSIDISLSQSGFTYQLRNDADNSLIGSAVSGTGGTISLPTGNLSATRTFNVLVTGAAPSNCSGTLTTKPTVTVTLPPDAALAGPDQTICSSTGTTTMSGNSPSAGTGAWSFISGPSTPSITSPSDPFTSITGLTTAGTYRFQWTISNAPCTASSDLVDIVVNDAPTTANAGSNQAICSTGSASLAANNPAVGTGSWSISSGPSTSTAQFSDITNRLATFTPSGGAGTYVLVWTISNAPCTASTSSLNIVVTASPTTPTAASTTQPTCTTPSGTIVFTTQAGVEYSIGGAYQVSETFSGLIPGTYTLSVRSTANNTCITNAASTVTINAVPSATISYTGTPFSASLSTPQNVTLTGTPGGTFSSTAGLSINSANGDITPSTSTAGTYTVSYSISGSVCATTSVTIDNTLPSVDIQGEPAIVNSTAPYTVTIQFSEDVTGFVIGDITVGNGSASNFVAVDGNTYTVDITPGGTGNITIDVAAGVAQDAAANSNTAAAQAVTVFNSDNEAVYTIATAQNVDSYTNGNSLATVTDANGAITSAVVSAGTLPPGTSINATTGEITVTDNTLLVAGTYTFSVTTTDANGGTTTQSVTITFTGNSPPNVAGATVSLDENSPNGTLVHQVIASDIDPGDILTYSIISGNISNAFLINPNTGEIVVSNMTALDFETNPVFTLTVQVTDSQGNRSTAIVIINLIDTDDEDTDGDGVPDSLEKKSGVPIDTDGDGIPDFKDTDDDNDGKPTIEEDNNKDGNYFNDDCDNDGIPDYLDRDQCKIKPSLGFSPNGDGNSDVWVIDFIEDYPNNTVKIFNRWGNQVYETRGYNNTDNAWDGQSNGKLTIGDFSSPDGTYFYVIDLGEGSKPIGGYIIIKR